MKSAYHTGNRQTRLARAARGFTLVELMVVLAVAAILISAAVPNFQQTIANYRLNVEVNALVGDLQFARSEAIKQGTTVLMCPTRDGATCSGDNAWAHGYLIGLNLPTAAGTVGADPAPVLRAGNAFSGADSALATYAGTGADVDSLEFGREGFAGVASSTSWSGFASLPDNVFIRVMPAAQSPGTGHCIAISKLGLVQVLAPGAKDSAGDIC